MGKITYTDAIAIVQLVYFLLSFGIAIAVMLRHKKDILGWFFIATFSLVRVVGSAARIDTITHPTSNTAYTVALVCGVFGLSPLLMSSLSLASRA
jgi:hypothetical protein